MHKQQVAFENIVGKGEIACNKQFLLFLQCFLLNQIIVSPFVHIFEIISLLILLLNLKSLKDKGLMFNIKFLILFQKLELDKLASRHCLTLDLICKF